MFPHDDMLLVVAGTAICTVGLLSLCAHFITAMARERILLWFGLFAAPYGLALVCRSAFLPERDSRVEVVVVIVGKLIGLVAGIPALLLFQEFYGTDGRLSSKWMPTVYSLILFCALGLRAMHDRPTTTSSPGIALVILVPLALLIDHFAGHRSPQMKGRPIILSGLLIFFLTFTYDHIANLRSGEVQARSEPFGFLVLTLCLGYVVSRRVVANETEWISMAEEMTAARRIQSAILPTSMPRIGNWSVAARYAPMTAVAGDFYGFPLVTNDLMDIILADVWGHGVPAALVASMVKVAVFAGFELGEGPGTTIMRLNSILCREAPGQYSTAVYVSLSEVEGVGRYCSAGHPPPFLWRRHAQTLETLDLTGLLLGVRARESYDEREFRFEKGDRLLLYSDGLTEAENDAGVNFGDITLPELFESNQDLPAERFADLLLQSVLAWSVTKRSRGQSDDITFVLVDFN